jgi:hypothetical protein
MNTSVSSNTRALSGIFGAAALSLALTAAGGAHAADKPADKKAPAAPAKPAAGKLDPTGQWTWTITTPNGQTFEPKLTLKLEGGKLSGSMSGRGGNERPIEEATLTKDEISFKVVRERDGRKSTMTYKGKLSGDTITGTMAGTFGDQERSNPWEAKRVKS